MKVAEFVHENANAVVRLAPPNYSAVSSAARAMIDKSRANPNDIMKLERDGDSDIYLIGGQRLLFYADRLKLVDGKYVPGEPLTTIWDDVLSNNLHNEGGVEFPKGKKPEALIKRCLDLATDTNDLVLDSFAGSGTTGAVAHKMGRRWIMVALGAHCHTHVIPRLKAVINGEDKGGVTGAVGWQGGGGFRYFKLAPSLLATDKWGRKVINKTYNAEKLVEALCKLEGFTYAPSDAVYWQHGHSTERDFIYVTTQTLGSEQLQQLSEEVGGKRALLVLCAAFRGNPDRWPNLTVKKVPNHIRFRCEWGHDDYSLNVENLPKAPPRPEPEATSTTKSGAGRAARSARREEWGQPMNRHVNAIAGRLSLRAPQRRSLEILDRITALAPPTKGADIEAALTAIRREFPTVLDFEREFPSLCFALATGVGKTRVMGAFIGYLHLAHGLSNFLVLAPNLTIYNKLITDFTLSTPKYVLKGISEFAVAPPVITTGDNYERPIASGGQLFPTTINIFNISKINSEVRGGRTPRIRSFREEIGESYFDYLTGLHDLVLIMDESHRYRASAGIRAISELQPVLGLELTATPFVETNRGPVPFKNVIFHYPLGRAMADGFVKEPAVVTRKNFNPGGHVGRGGRASKAGGRCPGCTRT